MKDLLKMRMGVLRQLKNVHKFFNAMERNVKSGNPLSIQRAYMFLMAFVYHLDEGQLTPDSIAYNLELKIAMDELEPQEKLSRDSILSLDNE